MLTKTSNDRMWGAGLGLEHVGTGPRGQSKRSTHCAWSVCSTVDAALLNVYTLQLLSLRPSSGGAEVPHCLLWTHFFHWCLSISVGVCYGQAHWLRDYAGALLMTCHVPTSIHCILIYHLTHKEQSYFPYIRVWGWCISIGPAIINSSYTW